MDEPRDSFQTPPVDQTIDPLELDAVPKTTWPTVIGVIGVILASLGLLGGCCGLAYPVYWPAFIDWMSTMAPKDQVDVMVASQPPAIWIVGSSVIGLLLAAMLMTGSIKILKRRRSGVTWLLTWSVLNIPWTVIAVIVGILLQWEQAEKMKELPGASPGQEIGMYLGSCVGLVFGLTFPLFLLIWLGRGVIKDEVAGWSEGEFDTDLRGI